MSERSRKLLRRAAVYGLASAMNAAEELSENAKAEAAPGGPRVRAAA